MAMSLCWRVDSLLNAGVVQGPRFKYVYFRTGIGPCGKLFHELGHQEVFARGDTDFNEAFATTVGQEGTRRWLLAKGDTNGIAQYTAELARNDDFVRLIMQVRLKLEALYGDERTEAGKVKATRKKRGVPPEQLREEKRVESTKNYKMDINLGELGKS